MSAQEYCDAKKNHNYFPHLPIGSYCEDLMKNTPSMKHFNDVCTNCISVPFGIFEKTSTIALVFQKFTMYASLAGSKKKNVG